MENINYINFLFFSQNIVFFVLKIFYKNDKITKTIIIKLNKIKKMKLTSLFIVVVIALAVTVNTTKIVKNQEKNFLGKKK